MSNLSISAFSNLEKTAFNYVINLFNRREIKQPTLSKIIYNTLLPKGKISENAFEAFKIKNVEQLEYGSSSLYLHTMRHAVEMLKKEPNLPTQEKEILEKWLEATRPTQQIVWIYDYFRVKIPNILSMILQGRNPLDSIIVRIFSYLYAPKNSEINKVIDFAIANIKELKPGSCFVIPAGTLIHEAILIVEKDLQGNFTLVSIDPNERSAMASEIQDMKILLDPSFWKKCCRAKFQKYGSYPLEWKSLKTVQEVDLLQRQSGNRCFAHCHWGFFRYFTLKYFPSSSDQSFILTHALETKIKGKIFEVNPPSDSSMKDLISQWLNKKKSKQKLIYENLDIKKLSQFTLSILDQTPKTEKIPIDYLNIIFSIEDLRKRINNILSSAISNQNKATAILKIAKRAYFNMYKKNQSLLCSNNVRSFEVFQEFLHQWSLFEANLKKAFSNRINQTLEKIETVHGYKTAILSFFNRWNPYNQLDLQASINGVRYFDYFVLHNQFSRVLFQLSSPQEVLAWSKRVIEIASRSDSRMQNLFFGEMNNYLLNSQFDEINEEWIRAKNTIIALIKNKIPDPHQLFIR